MKKELIRCLVCLVIIVGFFEDSIVGAKDPEIEGSLEPGDLANPILQSINLNPPGARSLGMGATFVGLADDATAAEANPAGLVILAGPEMSMNLRFARTGSYSISPFSRGFNDVESFEDQTTGPSYVSYVRPWSERKMAFSVYYQQVANIRSHERFDFGGVDKAVGEFDLLMENVGFSAAIRLGQNFALGVSIRYANAQVDLENNTAEFIFDESDPLFEGSTSVLFDRYRTLGERADDGDSDITVNAGFMVNPGGRFSVGGVYKQGADFEFAAETRVEFFFPRLELDPFVFSKNVEASYSVPDAYGFGLAYRPNSNWILAADFVHILYSDTTSRFADRGPDGLPLRPSDETEIHFGFEYGFTLGSKNTPVFVRAGFYTNPDHDASSIIDSKQEFVTLGGGVFLKEKLQLDGALALSQDVTEALVSMVWRL